MVCDFSLLLGSMMIVGLTVYLGAGFMMIGVIIVQANLFPNKVFLHSGTIGK